VSKTIGVGLVGTGWIGRVHAEQYLRVPQLCPLPGVTIRLQAVADMVPKLAQSAAADFGFARWYTSWQELIADPQVDLVDICLPNTLHREVAVAAAAAGKHVFCEKPMSTSAEEGRIMFEAAEAAGVCHMVNFNYRRVPAIAFAKQLLDQNVIGEVYHFRTGFSQDFAADPQKPWSWQFDIDAAGGGSLLMMGPHVIDCARYLVGDLPELMATLHTSVTERPKDNSGVGQVNVDDSAAVLVRFHTGCVGILYTTWLAYGRKHHFEWEINASRGSLYFNSERLNELQICEAADPKDRQGFKTIYVGEHHPYADIFRLKSGMGIGIRETFLLQIYELLRGIVEETPLNPSFYDGWQVDRIIQAVAKSSVENRWVQL
jgi:predicted dehydrogenase